MFLLLALLSATIPSLANISKDKGSTPWKQRKNIITKRDFTVIYIYLDLSFLV